MKASSMTAAKHTPGPWSASKIEDRAAFNIFTPGNCSALLTLEPGKYDGADPRIINVEANARLIAAAPDLLLALEMLLDWHASECPEDEDFSAVRDARAAIAKATGK